MRGIGDLCCTTEKKDRQGENRNRPFIHGKDLPSLETKITHQAVKCKGSFPSKVDFMRNFDIASLLRRAEDCKIGGLHFQTKGLFGGTP